jgi:hypothetical protein
MSRKKLTEEHIDVLDRANALGLDTLGYGQPNSKWNKLKERVEAKEATLSDDDSYWDPDGSPSPPLGEGALSSGTRLGRSDPPPNRDKPGEGPEHRSETVRSREEDPSKRLRRLLEGQAWRCAFACGDHGEGRPLLPGEPFAYIDDGMGIVHLDCMKSGTVPSEGNPWTINGAPRGNQ